jgi:surfeit locus 1 family protein
VSVVVLVAVAVRLGAWQLNRLEARRATNALARAAQAAPVIDLSVAPAIPGRRAVARGRFDAAGQLLLRSRVHRAAPGVHVVTAFRLVPSGDVVWVLRGFAPAADGVHPDSIAAPLGGEVEIRGTLFELPVTDDLGQPLVSQGDTTWRRLDREMARDRLRGALPVVMYLEGDAAGPGQLPAVEPPALDDGPHLSYALQWFAIALAIAAFGVYALRTPAGRGPAPPLAAP